MGCSYFIASHAAISIPYDSVLSQIKRKNPPPPLFPSFISDYFTYFIAHIFLHNFM